MRVAAIVPSLNPNEQFRDVIAGLISAGFNRIYIVDDGSDKECSRFFEEAGRNSECVILRHESNCGKGRALKTAIDRYLRDGEDLLGIVTLDGDGQHGAGDVVKVAHCLETNPHAMVLGSRDFSQSHVPKKSAMGNKITSAVFRTVLGITINDTQTGLRGIPNSFLKPLLDVEGERYEFETNMLLATKKEAVPIIEVPIETIYIDNNSASHFRPLWDSLRIYLQILKFGISSLSSFLLDIGLFTLVERLLADRPASSRLFFATAIARVCSSIFNFSVNRAFVFNKRGGGTALVKYASLVVCQLLASYGLVYLLSAVLPLPEVPAKILADTFLFFISFFIQRRWVFAPEGGGAGGR